VEPIGKWGKGAINLMEIPTTGETLDNIVCFWPLVREVFARCPAFREATNTGARGINAGQTAADWRR
jgi:hypothetical protein